MRMYRRMNAFAWCLAALAAGARAEITDFEGPAYAAGHSLIGADGWQAASAAAGDFLVQSGAAGEGRWARVRAATAASAYRSLPGAAGASPLLDVRWRWRALSDSVRFCVGLASGAGTSLAAARAQACLEPGGAITVRGAGDLALPAAETWRTGAWLYMRIALDNVAGEFSLYVSDDSLRATERAALPAAAMAGTGAAARIELRGGGGSGYADADDLSWEPVAVWQPAGTDTLWSNGKNWSTGAAPDSNTRVLFPAAAGATRGCLLDKAATVRGITVAPGAKGLPDLGAQTLSVLGDADFTGGANATGGGQVRFPSPRPASLIGPEGVKVMPGVKHDGPGLLRLDGRALSAAGLIQSGGVFDFNGFDLNVIGPWRVQAGRPGTLRNLAGRAVIVTQGARLEGVSADTLLGLAASAPGWTLSASGTDSVSARHARLGNARATGRPGVASASVDAGGNTGWTFVGSPIRPPAPRALPSGGVFGDSVVTRVFPPEGFAGAQVFCLLDPPPAGASGPGAFPCPDSLVIRVSSVLKAYAVAGSQAGDTARWDFRRGLSAPSLSPRGRDFPDTLRVTAGPADSGAVVRYTLDGTPPGPASPAFPSKGLLLDSSVDLLAAAVRGIEVGSLAAESYNLAPDTPSALPRGGDYSSPVRIALASGSARALIWYTLDGTEPGPDRGLPAYTAPFMLGTEAVLKAVAVAGQGAKARRSPMRVEKYTFIAPGKRTLQPGQRLALSGNYSLASPLAGASPVDVEILAADSVTAGLAGFRDVLFGIRLSVPAGASAFPRLELEAPAGERRSLYRLSAPGFVRWITSADTASVEGAGAYFLGLDTAAPTVKYAGETFTAEDSTRLVVTIEDNVQNLGLDLERTDDPALGFSGREVNPVMILALNVKNPPGEPRPLRVRLRVTDHVNAGAFPAQGAWYPLAQKFTGTVRSPDAFRIGDDPAEPWDLIAIPLAPDKPLTLSRLRKDNPVAGLEGAVFDPSAGRYRILTADDPIPPGRGVWLSARGSLPSLSVTGSQTASQKGAAPRLILRPGWNQVANPGLARLWWPVSHSDPVRYRASLLKGLHAWDAAKGGYVPSDSLEPWRGYFVRYGGGRDTSVDLAYRPPEAPAAPKAAAAGGALALSLAWRGGATLRLGADEEADDGFGMEDDLRPPARSGTGSRLYSDREGAQLGTDLARWRPGAIYAWKVVAGLSARAAAGPGGDSSAALYAGADRLPPGYAAWAVSRARGMRFALAGAGGRAGMPWKPGFADTLEVLAGPAAAVEARLGGYLLRPGPFAAKALPQPGGYLLRLDLPAAARLRLTVCAPDGRVAEERSVSLPEGRYLLPGGGHWAAGVYVMRLRADGPPGSAVPGRMTLKLAVP